MPSPLPMSTSVPIAVSRSSRPLSSSQALPPSAYLALPISDISAPPVFNQRSSQSFADPSRSQLVAAMAVAGLLGALFMVWFGSRRIEPTGSRLDPIGVSASNPWPGGEPARAVQEPEELLTSRSVLIESQPSGALVNVGGQVLGVTPLSTLLPVGTQQLSISKPGYLTEQAFVQLDAAPRGAKVVRTRVVLQEGRVELPSAAQPSVTRPTPPKVARPVARRAPPRRPEVPREEAAAAPSASEPAADPPPVEPSPTPAIVEVQSRPRLIDEQPRARLLE
jgi:hypothetical protein